MSSYVRVLFATALLASGLPFLTACLPDMSMLDLQERKTVAAEPAPVEEAGTPASYIPPFTPGLYCRVGRGSAFFSDDWYDFNDTGFTMYKGGKVNVRIGRRRHTDTTLFQAIFDGNGQKMVFCPLDNVTPGQEVSCSSLYTLEEDLKAGIKRTFDIPQAVRGGTISCAYQKESIKSLVTPAGGGN